MKHKPGLAQTSRTRSVALLALAAVIPLLVLAAVLTQWYAGNAQNQLDMQLERSAVQTANVVTRELKSQVELLTILAESPRLDPPLQPALFGELADRLRAKVPVWASLRVTGTDGSLLLTSPPLGDGVPAKLVDPASHAPVAQTGVPVVGDMVRGPRGNLAFAVRVPVVRNGSIVYVFSALLRPSLLSAALQSTSLPAGWNAWLTDGSGRIIASSGVDIPELEQFSFDQPGPGLLRTNWAGEIRLTRESVPDQSWQVFVAMPAAEWAKPRQNSWLFFVTSIALALLLSGLAWALGHRELRTRREQDAAMANWQRLDALSKLAGGLAHDFNNLLMGLQGGIDQLRRRRYDDARFDAVSSMMGDAVERGKQTTQRLLSFSRRTETSAEALRLQDRTVALTNLVEQCVKEDVIVSVEITPDTWPVRIDASAFDVALVNIASNARDAMPGGGRFTIKVRNVQRAEELTPQLRGPHVAISLADTGVGIAPENLSRIFDPFFTTKGNEASGLGLSQVYGFAARSGGTIVAASVPGSGTMITLLLPMASLPASAAGPQAMRKLRGLSALVVDDQLSVAEAVAGMLEGMGVVASTAGSAAEGLERLAAGHFEILVTDVTMPGMSGLDFGIESQRLYPDLCVYLMTGYSAQLEAGAPNPFPVLAKPFQREALRDKLAERFDVTLQPNVVQLDLSRK
jgi:signal transduction histidine kinase/CheY-like chemotaxis protein